MKTKQTTQFIAAQAVLAACTKEERAELFRQSGECTCADLGKFVIKNPAGAIGAAIGAVLGIAVSGSSAETKSPNQK